MHRLTTPSSGHKNALTGDSHGGTFPTGSGLLPGGERESGGRTQDTHNNGNDGGRRSGENSPESSRESEEPVIEYVDITGTEKYDEESLFEEEEQDVDGAMLRL